MDISTFAKRLTYVEDWNNSKTSHHYLTGYAHICSNFKVTNLHGQWRGNCDNLQVFGSLE